MVVPAGPCRPPGRAAPSLVKGLGRWLGWKESIPLAAVLQAPPTVAATACASAAHAALQRELQRVQAELARLIADDSSTRSEDGWDFLPFRRHCFAMQQAMGAAITPLRAQTRAAVARLSPAMAQLAALDAVMANLLAPREQALLAQLPVLLDKHFTQLRDAAVPGGPPWLPRFDHDMRRLLHAELDLRLQPVLGLLATLQRAAETQIP
ncbi:MAG: DUF3348 family protein [Rubrivivax sp.]|nr:DUF3348 family protein [Rubrivivax sp.]